MTASAPVHPSVVVPRPLRTELGRSALLTTLAAPGPEVVALLAPSGYGKTTLLAQHARALGREALWLSLSASDSEVEFFVASLTRAVRRLGPVPELAAGTAPERAADALAGHLLDHWPGVGLYIDRTELLSPLTGQLLALFLEPLRGTRVFLSGVAMDTLPLARWTAAGQATVLGAAQLAFSALESEAFLQARGAAQEAQAVVAALEGWPAGVALAAGGAHTTLDPSDLMREALNVLPGALRSGLPEASVLSEWHDDLVRELGLQLPGGWLDTVRRAGLPVTPLGRGWYRPHGLLLGTLEAQLRRDPARFEALHAAQARRLAATDPLGALGHATLGQAHTLTLELAAQVLPRLKDRGEFSLMHATLEGLRLPDEPAWLREYRAVARIEAGQPGAGETELRALHAEGQTTALGFTSLALLATRRGEFAEQLRLAELGLALFPPEQTRSLTLQRAVALISLGQVHDGLRVCEAAAAEARARGAPLDEAAALTMSQYAHQMLGQWPERAQAVARASALLQEQRQGARAVPLLNILAEEALLRGEQAQAHTHLAEALEVARRSSPVMEPQLLLTRSQQEAAAGDLKGAQATLDTALDTAGRLRLDVLRPFLRLAQFEVLLNLGAADEAEAAYQDAAALLSGSGRQAALLPFASGLRAWTRGEWALAQSALTEATQQPGRTQPVRAQLYLLDLERRQRPLTAADAQHARAWLLGLNAGALLALDRVALAPLAASLSALDPGHPLAVLAGDAAPPTPGPLLAYPQLDVRALGRVQVTASGQAARLPLAKSAEVLVWLAWHGAGSSAEIMNDLWDGSRQSKHHEYFRVAVRRLRAALTQAGGWTFDPVPYDGQRYRLHPDLQVTLDARTVMTEAARGVDGLTAALDAYSGDLLPGAEGEWALRLRQEVRAALLDAVMDAARAHPGEQSLGALRRAALLEPAAEDINLTLIETLLPGQPQGALAAFRTYARQLRALVDEDVPEALVRRLRGLGLPLP
ncbi:hypothetical protein GO986_15215 [Deinococcus sp. HMF7620]|uniref:MalT-like winged helix domain-containing protein n=1 Tax=Deinococcus arboris TaxID=2682977 RepID=A0A7C9LSE4_9DEIO|nr:hypothetical protein [Deinococcus arboris]MVN88101.1 hypothetical protein [Deinococcus arboris]